MAEMDEGMRRELEQFELGEEARRSREEGAQRICDDEVRAHRRGARRRRIEENGEFTRGDFQVNAPSKLAAIRLCQSYAAQTRFAIPRIFFFLSFRRSPYFSPHAFFLSISLSSAHL